MFTSTTLDFVSESKQQDAYLDISPEVKKALEQHKPVVALESNTLCHGGVSYPENVELALQMEKSVRDSGAVPAIMAVLKGRLTVGVSQPDIEHLGKNEKKVVRLSRRDIPLILGQDQDGVATVAATMVLANMVGIKVVSTGGVGGVHRDAEKTFDISADLQELARTSVAVVCAGSKSIIDIGLTLEYLETFGVPVIGYGTTNMPSFTIRDSGFSVDCRMDSAYEIAVLLKNKWSMGLSGGVVIANPIPEQYELDNQKIKKTIQKAIEEMDHQGITGSRRTPFLLQKVNTLTDGESLGSNIQLILNNARLAAEIASEYVKMP